MFGKNKDSNQQPDIEMFTIYDTKTQTYKTPSQAPNQQDLIRQLINLFKDPTQQTNMLVTNAEDFSVFRIGTFDKRTGVITATNLEHVINLHDLRSAARPDLGIVPT